MDRNKPIIGIIGPSKGYIHEDVETISQQLSEILVRNGYSAVITLTKDSSFELFGKVFKRIRGSHLYGITYPHPGVEGYEMESNDELICDEQVECASWEEQPKVMVQMAKHMVALGISPGTTWEIMVTKYYWRLGVKTGLPRIPMAEFLYLEIWKWRCIPIPLMMNWE